MAIVAMLGYDNLNAVSGLTTTDVVFPVSYPNLMKSPVSQKDISAMVSQGANYKTSSYLSTPDPDGVNTISVCFITSTTSTGLDVAQECLMGMPTTDTTLDKTGKWTMGLMVYVPNIVSTAGVLAVIGDLDDRTKNVGVMKGSASPETQGFVVGAGTAYYLEAEIDWVNKTVKGWVDGVQVSSTTFGTNPFFVVGNFQAMQYTPALGTSPWFYGNYSLQNSASYQPRYAHLYFAIDKANDTAPTGRLGPIRVKPTPVASVDLKGNSVADNSDPVATSNLNVSLGQIPSTGIVLDTAGAKDTFHFTAPTLLANEERIVAVQYELFTYKKRDAAANAVFNFSDGSTTTTDYTVIATENPRRDKLCMSTPFSGGTWTPEKLAGVTINVGSVRNN